MFNVIRIVALGLWVGALAGFAFFFAPAAFAHVGPTQAFSDTIAACILALVRFGWLMGAIAVATAILDRAMPRRHALAMAGAVAIAFAATLVEALWVVPQMQATPVGGVAFAALHRTSSTVYGAGLLAALAALVAASWRPAYR